MATKIEWTNKSITNLKNIHSYISRDSIIYANRFVKSLIQTTEKQLINYPKIGRLIPELKDSQLNHLRELIFKGYRIIYNPLNHPTKITIIAVINGRMDFSTNLLQDPFDK